MFFGIFMAGIIVGIFVVCVLIYFRPRWLRKRPTESTSNVQDANQDPVYDVVDLKSMAQNYYESERGSANNGGYSNYADLSKEKEAENTYQSLT